MNIAGIANTRGRGGRYERVVYLGDSITYGNNGAGGRAASPYPTVAEATLGRPSRSYVNAGVNSKYLRDILPSDALIYSPTIVSVAGGINDIYNLGGAAPSLATLQGYINALITAFRAAGVRMVFGTVLHDNLELSAPAGAKEILRQDFNAWLRTLAATDIRIADPAEDPLLIDNNNVTYFGTDKVHPTQAGYDVIGPYYAGAMAGL